MADDRTAPVSAEASLTLALSRAELAEIDAWAAEQADRPSREVAARRLIRQALGRSVTPDGHGMRPEELNAENDG